MSDCPNTRCIDSNHGAIWENTGCCTICNLPVDPELLPYRARFFLHKSGEPVPAPRVAFQTGYVPVTATAITPSGLEMINQTVRQVMSEAIAAERQRCAGIVENVLDRHRNGESMDDDLLAQDLKDEIIKGINADE